MAKVSVIVPIYGVEKYLEECLKSILKQTLLDIEIILINDGSKDSCPEIIDKYAQTDSRIKCIHKTNGGYGQSCNVGLANACGEYVSIIEPDDFIDIHMLENLYNIAKKFDSDIVKSAYYDNLQASNKRHCKKVQWENNKIPQNRSFTIIECPLFLSYHPSIWSCIYKKEFLIQNKINFQEIPGSGWSDNLFQVQTMCLAEKINYTSDAYYYWRRLQKNESNELSDWTIPYKRTLEIHNWLKSNNIKDENILSCLYKREFSYIKILINKKYSIFECNKIEKTIKSMISQINFELLEKSPFINKKDLKRIHKTKLKTQIFLKKLNIRQGFAKMISQILTARNKNIVLCSIRRSDV